MRFAYMDEAGNTGRRCDDPTQPIHLILSLAIDESKIPVVHEHIRKTARRYCPTCCDDPNFEFHGQELYSGRGHFRGLPPQRRFEIYDAVLRGIALADAEVIVQGVDKARLQRRYAKPFHPHDVALMFTIETIERMARGHDCFVLLVADEAKEVEDTALRDLANYQQVGTSWGVTEQIDQIVDTIHFVPSHTNPGIQLADCATYVVSRLLKIQEGLVTGDGPYPKAIERLWENHIEPNVHTNRIWRPAS
jgi:Protein of unknown function (DUF3800)